MNAPAVSAGLVVTARPRRTAWLGWIGFVVILTIFTFVALVMRHHTAGAHFLAGDQLGTFLIGLVLALTALLPVRPRLYADATGVRLRAFLGGERIVQWSLITRVDFPANLRFARIVLPGEETLAIYAVQRWDHEQSVTAMRGLRQLFAEAKEREASAIEPKPAPKPAPAPDAAAD